MDANFFHCGNEVEGIAAAFALAETIPDIFGATDAELGRVAALVDGTRPVQAVGAALELVHEAIMLKDLFHGDGRFDGPEVNERIFCHIGMWLIVKNGAAHEFELHPSAILRAGKKVGRRQNLQIWQVEKRRQFTGFAGAQDGREQIFFQNGLVREKKQTMPTFQLGTRLK